MERFDLAAWELAPDSPEQLEGVASGRVKAKWLGRERELLLREVEIARGWWILFLRDEDLPDAGNWIIGDYATWRDAQKSLWRVKRHSRRIETKRTPFENELYRVFHFPFLLNTAVTIKPGGEVALQKYNNADATPTRFRLNRSGLEETSLRCLQRLQDEFSTQSSRGHFALQWEQLKFDERSDLVVNCRQGSYSQMRALLANVLIHAVQDDANFQKCHWTCWFKGKSKSGLRIEQSSNSYGKTYPETAHLQAWREALTDWFHPSMNEALPGSFQCASIWKHQLRANELFTVSTSIPTQHERLEAALELRDWARGKVPDELLQTLL